MDDLENVLGVQLKGQRGAWKGLMGLYIRERTTYDMPPLPPLPVASEIQWLSRLEEWNPISNRKQMRTSNVPRFIDSVRQHYPEDVREEHLTVQFAKDYNFHDTTFVSVVVDGTVAAITQIIGESRSVTVSLANQTIGLSDFWALVKGEEGEAAVMLLDRFKQRMLERQRVARASQIVWNKKYVGTRPPHPERPVVSPLPSARNMQKEHDVQAMNELFKLAEKSALLIDELERLGLSTSSIQLWNDVILRLRKRRVSILLCPTGRRAKDPKTCKGNVTFRLQHAFEGRHRILLHQSRTSAGWVVGPASNTKQSLHRGIVPSKPTSVAWMRVPSLNGNWRVLQGSNWVRSSLC